MKCYLQGMAYQVHGRLHALLCLFDYTMADYLFEPVVIRVVNIIALLHSTLDSKTR
jgi:hypothetical protein